MIGPFGPYSGSSRLGKRRVPGSQAGDEGWIPLTRLSCSAFVGPGQPDFLVARTAVVIRRRLVASFNLPRPDRGPGRVD
jgi:hypothetical protein